MTARPIGASKDLPGKRLRAGGAGMLAAAVLLAACGTSPPVRYHALSAVAAPGAVRAAYAGPAIEIASVQFPPTLLRPELVRDTAAGRFEVREFDHWAAPLPRLARQVLAEDLESRLPAGKIVYPGATWPQPGVALDVDVLSFRVADGTGTMILSWSLRTRQAAGAPPVPVRGAQLRLETPAPEQGPEATTRALNELLGQVSDRVVAEVVAGR